jgi:hypothetical protein
MMQYKSTEMVIHFLQGIGQSQTFPDVDEPVSEAQKNSLVSLYNGSQGLWFCLKSQNDWENNVYLESV